ncbi:MAG: hypothetical protein JO311_00055 [Candidatus Eremiobacteraeota bacterium]|nr:hypothetical protein [Candidatus Eremiobacteraeota bacterium]MBV9262874.1 hypothetical protein [Candidatus Eremiobacteraeota bacterium]
MIEPRGLSPAAVQIKLFTMPMQQTDPVDVAVGAKGYLYATQPIGTPASYLWQISETGYISKVKPSLGYEAGPGITGAKGVVYFGKPDTGGWALLAYANGKFDTLGGAHVNAIYYLKRAKDGSVWFSDPGDYTVGHIANGKASLYPAPTKYCSPYGITIGADQNVWVTEQCATTTGRIGRITATGSWKEFVLPTKNEEPPSGADSITAGPDGNLWYTIGAPRIGRITTAGKIHEFSLPASDGDGYAIAVGNDKALWYTLQQSLRIGRMTIKGSASSYKVPSNNSLGLTGICAGSGNTIWFTATTTNQIGRLTY